MNATRWTFRITTGLFTALIGMGVVMYITQHDMVAEMFTSLGYPPYLIYPLAIAKTLGLIAITTRLVPTLTQMAYAGFFFELMLAAGAHIAVGDGGAGGATVALMLAIASYASSHRLSADTPTLARHTAPA